MIKIEQTQIWGFEHSLRGMRNPLNSWEKADTIFIPESYADDEEDYNLARLCAGKAPIIKENDMRLCKRLASNVASHRKFLRQIFISCDITAPILWWKEMDQYKIGTGETDFETDSCSTMHTIVSKEFSVDDFSYEHMNGKAYDWFKKTVDLLNELRNDYRSSLEVPYKKMIWRNIIDILPECYNQKRTTTLNYEVAMNIYASRKDHKLTEWHDMCHWIYELPYFKEFWNAKKKEIDVPEFLCRHHGEPKHGND